MDLASFSTLDRSEAGVWVDITRPIPPFDNLVLEDGRAVRVCVRGRDSIAFQRANELVARDGFLGGLKTGLDEQDTLSRAMALLIVGWEGVVFEGQELECTPENAARLMKALPWMRMLLDRFLANRENFLPPSSSA